jgi:hypothetical protein
VLECDELSQLLNSAHQLQRLAYRKHDWLCGYGIRDVRRNYMGGDRHRRNAAGQRHLCLGGNRGIFNQSFGGQWSVDSLSRDNYRAASSTVHTLNQQDRSVGSSENADRIHEAGEEIIVDGIGISFEILKALAYPDGSYYQMRPAEKGVTVRRYPAFAIMVDPKFEARS